MLRRIISLSLRFRVLLVVAAVAVMFSGFAQLNGAPRDVYPEFEPPTVEIQTEALGLSAQEVEQLITVPLEADLLNGVAWVDDIRSESVLGLSSVTMVFEPGTDLYRARQAVQERLSQAHALPNVSKPPQMLQPTSSTSRAMMIGLTSDKLSLIELSQLARWTIKPRLQGVQGVANVASFGHRERQLQVQVDPKRLAERGVALQQVVASTGNSLWVSPLTFLEASTPGTGGFIETQNQRLGIRHVSPIESAADLGEVAIEGKPGVTLADVATVVEDHQPLIGDAQINGGPGILLVVEKLRGANTVEVTAGVEKALANMAPALKDVKTDTGLYRPADYIKNGSANVQNAAVAASVILLVLLAFAFYRWRSALIAVVAILTSMLGAVAVLLVRGETLNSMVLAGLAVALAAVVDDAVSGSERIVRTLRQNADVEGEKTVAGTVLDSLTELRGALGYATVLVLLPVLPVFFMDGRFHYFGRPLAISYAIAILVSMVVALTVTPALAVLLYSKAAQAGPGSQLGAGLGRRYVGGLGRIIAAPRRAVVVALVLAAVGIAALPALGDSELPALRERDFLVEIEAKPGTSLPEMNRITGDAARALLALPGIRNVSSHSGRAITGDRIVNVNNAEMWVRLRADADYGRTVGELKRVVGGIPDVDTDVLTYQQFALKEVTESDADGPIVVRVYGHNEDVLVDKAKELGAALGRIDGITAPQVELPKNEPTLEVEVDLEKAAGFGVKPGDVRRAAATVLAGIEVGSLFYDQKVFEVVVWGTPDVRQDAADVENLLIETNKGLVPLKELANVRTADSPSVIEREGAFRRIDISADVTGRSRDAVAADIRKAIASTQFPLEFRAELLGGFVEKQADDRRLLALAGFALLAMLLLLQACFGSWTLGFVVFLTLPVALVGGLLAAIAYGGTISIGACVGLLALLGLAARHAIVLIKRYQSLQRRDGMPFGIDLVLKGAQERFVPMVVAALATGLAFVPALVIGDAPGQEIIRPMAIVILGGLLTVLPVGLIVIPAVYLAFGGKVTETEVDILLFEEELATSAPPAYAAAAAAGRPAADPQPTTPGDVTS
jgi:CzcA family heavy metal efflux pump